MNVEVCEVLTKPKLKLTLVQERPLKNDYATKKIGKISISRVLYFKPTPTNLTAKRLIFCL
jgi:hypothetical protein